MSEIRTALSDRDGIVHRCVSCGTIAEWHYQLKRDEKTGAASPRNVYPGEKCWGAGQPSIGNDTHAVTPDYTNPIRLSDLTPHKRRSPAA